ncbi:hypothetical protein ACWC2H_23005 [Streptomyces sp. 900105755]
MDLSTGTPRILVVDDAKDLTDLPVTVVRAEGRRTEPAPDGTTVTGGGPRLQARRGRPGRGLPDLEGLEVLRRLRVWRPDAPPDPATAGSSSCPAPGSP